MPKNKKPIYRLTCKSSAGDWDVDIYCGRDYEAAQEWARNMRHTMLQLWRDGAVIQEFMPIYRITASTTAGTIIPVIATPPESAIEKCARKYVNGLGGYADTFLKLNGNAAALIRAVRAYNKRRGKG